MRQLPRIPEVPPVPASAPEHVRCGPASPGYWARRCATARLQTHGRVRRSGQERGPLRFMFIRAHGMFTRHTHSRVARRHPPGTVSHRAALPLCQTKPMAESAGGSLRDPRVPRVMSSVARRLPRFCRTSSSWCLCACHPTYARSLSCRFCTRSSRRVGASPCLARTSATRARARRSTHSPGPRRVSPTRPHERDARSHVSCLARARRRVEGVGCAPRCMASLRRSDCALSCQKARARSDGLEPCMALARHGTGMADIRQSRSSRASTAARTLATLCTARPATSTTSTSARAGCSRLARYVRPATSAPGLARIGRHICAGTRWHLCAARPGMLRLAPSR